MEDLAYGSIPGLICPGLMKLQGKPHRRTPLLAGIPGLICPGLIEAYGYEIEHQRLDATYSRADLPGPH